MNGGQSKIRSLHTYVVHPMCYFERYCRTRETLYKTQWFWEHRAITEKVFLQNFTFVSELLVATADYVSASALG